MCSTHCEQHPHVGVLKTSTSGPDAFCWAAAPNPTNASAAVASAIPVPRDIGTPSGAILPFSQVLLERRQRFGTDVVFHAFRVRFGDAGGHAERHQKTGDEVVALARLLGETAAR